MFAFVSNQVNPYAEHRSTPARRPATALAAALAACRCCLPDSGLCRESGRYRPRRLRHDDGDGRLGARGLARVAARRRRPGGDRRRRPPPRSPSCASGADRSTAYVRDFTGLDAGARTAPVLVVDRPALDPGQRRRLRHAAHAGDRQGRPRRRARPGRSPRPSARGSPAPRSAALLGFLASKVLGQFDPFHEPHGRLLLVAPNVVHVERELDADPTRLPALGLPARGDPPGAVHRGAVDARPPVRRRSPRSPRPSSRSGSSTTGSSGSPRRSRTAAAAACSTCSARPSRRRSSTGSPA